MDMMLLYMYIYWKGPSFFSKIGPDFGTGISPDKWFSNDEGNEYGSCNFFSLMMIGI